MDTWSGVPVFGRPRIEGQATLRPSVYGLLVDRAGRLAVVRTPKGVYLPGGGATSHESPAQAVVREVHEECGLDVAVGDWTRWAVEFVYAAEEAVDFEKRCTFLELRSALAHGVGQESDHQLDWMTPEEAIAHLAPQSHRWAVAQWVDATHDRPE